MQTTDEKVNSRQQVLALSAVLDDSLLSHLGGAVRREDRVVEDSLEVAKQRTKVERLVTDQQRQE